MVSAKPSSTVRTRRVLEFLALAFGISWTGALVFALVGVDPGSIRGMVLVVAGIGAGLLATGACVVHGRYVAAERITSSGPLTPW